MKPCRIIDAHTHIAASQAAVAVDIMDRAGIDACVVAEWHDGFGPALEEHLAAFGKFPGRFHVFGNIDFSAIDEPDFAARAVEHLRRGAVAGMRGLKVYKSLGLELRDKTGQLLRADDPRLDPIWAAAGELHLPVLMHAADPQAFWQPIDPHNAWSAVLRNEPGWSYYRAGLPSRDELLAERARVIRRHPGTQFIGPHLGSWEDDFQTLAEMLEALPNFHVDIAARVYHMGSTPRRRAAARRLCLEFADRILFGSDTIILDPHGPADIQPQTFYTRDRLPARLASGNVLRKTSEWFYRFHRQFLETGRRQSPIPFLTVDPADGVEGLRLGQSVLEKIYHANIERLMGL